MKKYFIIFALFVPIFAIAQVNVLDIKTISKTKSKPVIVKYDSLSNICSSNWEQLVGQTLFLNSSSAKSRGFKRFLYYTANPDENIDVVNMHSYYQHYFLVKSRGDNYLELYDKELNETLYYIPNYSEECYSNFLVVGYYEKMKKEFIGNIFYCTDDYSHFDTSDGRRINGIQFKIPFKCIDVYASPNPFSNPTLGYYFPLKAIVESSQYGKLIVDITFKYKNQNSISGFISLKKYNSYIKKYGKIIGMKVAQHMVTIGMTKKMVQDSWGTPEKINEISDRYACEQWIYGNNYLYFKNGKLIDKQRF